MEAVIHLYAHIQPRLAVHSENGSKVFLFFGKKVKFDKVI